MSNEKIELLRKLRDTGFLADLHRHGLITSYPITLLACAEIYEKYKGKVRNPVTQTANELGMNKNTARRYLNLSRK